MLNTSEAHANAPAPNDDVRSLRQLVLEQRARDQVNELRKTLRALSVAQQHRIIEELAELGIFEPVVPAGYERPESET